MSKTYKDKQQYWRKHTLKRTETDLEATIYRKVRDNQGNLKTYAYKASNGVSAIDKAFREMDPEARFTWESEEGNYTRYQGLDWWLEFGFPERLEILPKVITDTKLRLTMIW
jgi:hypothetical protein